MALPFFVYISMIYSARYLFSVLPGPVETERPAASILPVEVPAMRLKRSDIGILSCLEYLFPRQYV